jgi:hypothetical protein
VDASFVAKKWPPVQAPSIIRLAGYFEISEALEKFNFQIRG